MRFARRAAAALVVLGATLTLVSAQENQRVHRSGEEGVVVPSLEKEVKPQYTPEALDARIQGSITVEAVVLADGTVGDITVTKSLDTVYGLDEQAVKAVKQWRFKPGTKDRKPVPVQVEIEITFTLK